jgi:hypothetical protein
MSSIFKTDHKSISLTNILEEERLKLGRESFLEADGSVKEVDNSLFYNTIDQNQNYKLSPEFFTETKFAWTHLSCASFISEVSYTARSAVKLHNLKETRFSHTCIICHQTQGACIKCHDSECQIYFHAECAIREGYYVDVGRNISVQEDISEMDEESPAKRFKRLTQSQNGDQKVFCEPHRPFKLIQQIEEKRASQIDEIQDFCGVLYRCVQTMKKVPLKRRQETERFWKEKDKKKLLD